MAMAAVTQGAALPEDATREQLMAYHKILDMQRQRLLRQQRELDERKRRADESSLRRAELSSIGGSSSHANGQHHKSRSRINNIPERERQEATRDLGNSFMTIDSAGNIMPKTPEGALVAATTYLMANPPPSDDPRYGVYRTALAGIGIVGAALDKTPADRAVATRRSNHSPPREQPAAPSTREPESASGRRRPRHPRPKASRQGPSGARHSRVIRLRGRGGDMRHPLFYQHHPTSQNAKRLQDTNGHPKIRWPRRTKVLARRLPRRGQVQRWDKGHCHAVPPATPEGRGTSLAQKPTPRLHRLVGRAQGELHPQLPVHVQEAGLHRRTPRVQAEA